MHLLINLALFLFAASAAGETHSLEELLRPGEIQIVTLSPDGRRVAYAQRPREGTADTLVVIEFEGNNPAEGIRRYGLDPGTTGARVARLDWVGNQRLLAVIQPDRKPRYRAHINAFGWYIRVENAGRLYVFDASGADQPVLLDERFTIEAIIDEAPRNPDFVTLMHDDERNRLSLYRVNLRDGGYELQLQGDYSTSDWRVIDGQPVLKLNGVTGRDRVDVYVPAANEQSGWVRIGSHQSWFDRPNELRPIAAAEAPAVVFRRAHTGTSNTLGIHRFDLAKNETEAALAEHPQYDVRDALIDRGRLLAWTFIDDRVRQIVVEPTLRPHHAALEKYFGEDLSVEIVDVDDDLTRLLVRVSGPRQPDEYHWYDTATQRAVLVVSDRPWLRPARLAPSVARRVRTRDGKVIDSYVTCPEQVAVVPVPLVVMPPAGPWARGALQFDATVQAFAAQGWCVLEPNYRGVAGYGLGFEWQGYGEWSDLVVADIADATDDLVKAGIVDPLKLVFYAEQLGAYAALVGSLEEPERYRAGVTWNAVTDIDAVIASLSMRFTRKSEVVRRWLKYRQDESRESSPLVRAGDLRCRLLLMRNTRYWEIPVSQTDLLVKAMRKADCSPEVLELPGDSTWSATASNDVLRMQRAVSFLRAILGNDGLGGVP